MKGFWSQARLSRDCNTRLLLPCPENIANTMYFSEVVWLDIQFYKTQLKAINGFGGCWHEFLEMLTIFMLSIEVRQISSNS